MMTKIDIYFFTFQRRSATQVRLSSSSLASIQEECTLPNDFLYQSTFEPNHSKTRFSIASDDSFQDGGSFCSGKSDTSKSNSTSLESLNMSLKECDEVLEPDTRTKEQIIEDFRQKFEATCGMQSSLILSRRRASIQVASLSSAPPPVDPSIRPKLRRASFQCEEVITKKFDRNESISKVISDFKLQYNFPSPLHAITRQYGSSSDITMKEKVEPSPRSVSKDLKSILSDWEIEKNKKTTGKSAGREQKQKSLESSEPGLASIIHARNSSCTSDYFGSTETLNTVQTFPIHDGGKTERRQSLPVNLSRHESLSNSVPKIPERRKSLLDKGAETKPDNLLKSPINGSNCPKPSVSDSDDGIFNEEDTILDSNKTNIVKPYKNNGISANIKSHKVPTKIRVPLETSL